MFPAVTARLPVTLPPIHQSSDISAIEIGPSTRQVARRVLTAKNRQKRQQQRIACEGFKVTRSRSSCALNRAASSAQLAGTLRLLMIFNQLVDETIDIDGGQWKQLETRHRLEPGALITGWSRRDDQRAGELGRLP